MPFAVSFQSLLLQNKDSRFSYISAENPYPWVTKARSLLNGVLCLPQPAAACRFVISPFSQSGKAARSQWAGTVQAVSTCHAPCPLPFQATFFSSAVSWSSFMSWTPSNQLIPPLLLLCHQVASCYSWSFLVLEIKESLVLLSASPALRVCFLHPVMPFISHIVLAILAAGTYSCPPARYYLWCYLYIVLLLGLEAWLSRGTPKGYHHLNFRISMRLWDLAEQSKHNVDGWHPRPVPTPPPQGKGRESGIAPP